MCDPTLVHVVQVFLRVIYLSREVKKLNPSACKCTSIGSPRNEASYLESAGPFARKTLGVTPLLFVAYYPILTYVLQVWHP